MHPRASASRFDSFASLPDAPGGPALPLGARGRADGWALLLVLAVAVVMWLPRLTGPIDLRWDGAVYYILGTSLAEGKGYRLLNEPGDIEAVQYPPLLPAIVAAHQLAAGTADPLTVGPWLRVSSMLVFFVYATLALRFLRRYVPAPQAVLGTLLSMFCLHAWFLSDALFPEVWFSVATLGFLIAAPGNSRAQGTLAYVSAVAAYGLRTIGLAAFAVWIIESVLRRRFREAVVRTLLALLPVASWQLYVASVEHSPAYNRPAYEYQRAPYMFYNVSYPTNIALRDPFTPEKGSVRWARRVVRNALDVPAALGETMSASRRYFAMWLHWLFGDGRLAGVLVHYSVFTALSLFGGVLVLGGLAVLLIRGHTVVPLYLLVYLAAVCLAPFPGQFLRYLMPVAFILALAAIVLLSAAGAALGRRHHAGWLSRNLPFAVLGPALGIQVVTAVSVFTTEYPSVTYLDRNGTRNAYRLFFYDDSQREYDEAIEYLRPRARAAEVIAAGVPHWIHLRSGHETVMPPFENDVARAQALLDSVPVRYLVVGRDVVASERYTAPVLREFAAMWQRLHTTAGGHWAIYRRVEPGAGPVDAGPVETRAP